MSETSRLRGGEGYGVRDDVVTLRRLRDARLPCDSGSKQVCFAAPRFFVLAPVHPRCSARLRRSFSHPAAAARRAASLRLGLKTGLLRSPSVFRPRSGPSALLRTPPPFV